MKKLSITTKITIWYTAFLLVITSCFLGVLVHTGNYQASEIAKTGLMEAVADAIEEIELVGEDFIIDKDLDFYKDGVYLSVYDGSDELVEGRRPIELDELPPLEDKVIVEMKDDRGQTWYIYDSLFYIDGEVVWVRGIEKDLAQQSSFSFMMQLAAFGAPVLVLAAALGGHFITRRAFRPVRDIIETVEEISRDGDLSRRINLSADRKGKAADRAADTAAKDEIYRLAVTFNGMFDKLEQAFDKEKQFTSDVSHELRTPLAVIISQSDYARGDPEYRERALEVIGKEARRMSRLVNRLLTLSRSDAGRLKLNEEKIDFSDMCEMVAEQQKPFAALRGMELSSDVQQGLQVWGDDSMLIRVLLNLTDNAIKYGREGGRITITLREENGFARCSVEDDGVGIAEEDLARIWERFYRVDSARAEEGSGLGLSIVEALVKAHGGHVGVESELGEGSRFDVYLPVYEQDELN